MAFRGSRFAYMSARNIFNAGPGMKVALFGVLLIPVMFAGFYLYAFFDPYATLDKIQVAVVNEDKGAIINDEQRNVGQEVCDELQDYDEGFGWVFVDADEAKQGMEDGNYYMTATIPEDFSERIASVDTDNPEAATLLITYDESENMLASQIGGSAWEKAQAVVNQVIIEEFWQNVLGRVADSAEDIMTASDGAQDLADGLAAAVKGSNTITSNLGVLVAGSSQLEDGAGSLSSGMQQLSSGSVSLVDGLSQLKDGSASLDNGLAQLKDGSSSLTNGLTQLEDGSTDLTDGLNKLEDGSSRVSSGLSQLNAKTSDLETVVSKLSTGADSVAAGVEKLNDALVGQLAPGSTQLATSLNEAAQTSANIKTATEGTDAYLEQALTILRGSDNVPEGAIAALEAARGTNKQATDGIRSLSTGLSGLSTNASTLSEGLKGMASQTPNLAEGASQVSGGLDQLNESVPELTGAIGQLSDGASDLQEGLVSASSGATSLNEGISSAADGASALEAGISSASSGAQALSSGTVSAFDGAETLSAGLSTATQGAITLASNMPALTDGAQQLQDGSATLVDGLVEAQEGSQTLSDSLEEGAESSALSQSEIDSKASVMSEPVDMEDEYYTEVANYGTGFAPFFIPLGIWVGCLLAGFLFKPLNTRIAMSGGNPFMVAFSGYIPLALYAVIQAVIALLFVQFALGATIDNVPLYYLVGIVCSLVFMAIMQFLVASFGFVGRFLAVFLLTLQLTSSAGTFPLELIPDLFNWLNPWMPMTYAVEGLRQAMTGVNTIVVGWDIAILCVFGLIFFVGTALYAYSKRTVKLTDIHPLLDL